MIYIYFWYVSKQGYVFSVPCKPAYYVEYETVPPALH